MRPTEIKSLCIEARYHRIKLEKKQTDEEKASRVEAISVPGFPTYSTIDAASMKKAHQNKMSNINTVTGFFWATTNHPIRSLNDGVEQIAGRSCQSERFPSHIKHALSILSIRPI